MKVEKYEALKTLIGRKYKVKLRFNDGKLNLDVTGPKGNIMKPIKRSCSRTTAFNLYGDNKDKWTTSKYELVCFLAGVNVIGIKEINLKFVNAHMEDIKNLIRRELKK
jgi:hypothetical protein